jgi:hypothetical protein
MMIRPSFESTTMRSEEASTRTTPAFNFGMHGESREQDRVCRRWGPDGAPVPRTRNSSSSALPGRNGRYRSAPGHLASQMRTDAAVTQPPRVVSRNGHVGGRPASSASTNPLEARNSVSRDEAPACVPRVRLIHCQLDVTHSSPRQAVPRERVRDLIDVGGNLISKDTAEEGGRNARREHRLDNMVRAEPAESESTALNDPQPVLNWDRTLPDLSSRQESRVGVTGSC